MPAEKTPRRTGGRSRSGGFLNEKYPGGVSAQKEKLEEEGHSVVEQGQRFAVANYEKSLAMPQDRSDE